MPSIGYGDAAAVTQRLRASLVDDAEASRRTVLGGLGVRRASRGARGGSR